MANTYDTSGEPLGSKAPKVLYNNASNLDDAMNSQVPSWTDRPPFNRSRYTWYGIEQAFNDFLINSGFEPQHLTYVDGAALVVQRPTQLIDRAGSIYRVKMPQSFPFTLTGTWATDQNSLVQVVDQGFAQSLADPNSTVQIAGVPANSLVTGSKLVVYADDPAYAGNIVTAAAAVQNGYTLVIRQPYNVTQPLRIVGKTNVSVRFEGAGKLTGVKGGFSFPTANARGVLHFDNCSGVKVFFPNIQGAKAPRPGDVQDGDAGIEFYQCSDTLVWGGVVKSVLSWGVIHIQCTNTRVMFCDISRCTLQSGVGHATVTDGLVFRCKLAYGGLYGVETEGLGNLNIHAIENEVSYFLAGCALIGAAQRCSFRRNNVSACIYAIQANANGNTQTINELDGNCTYDSVFHLFCADSNFLAILKNRGMGRVANDYVPSRQADYIAVKVNSTTILSPLSATANVTIGQVHKFVDGPTLTVTAVSTVVDPTHGSCVQITYGGSLGAMDVGDFFMRQAVFNSAQSTWLYFAGTANNNVEVYDNSAQAPVGNAVVFGGAMDALRWKNNKFSQVQNVFNTSDATPLSNSKITVQRGDFAQPTAAIATGSYAAKLSNAFNGEAHIATMPNANKAITLSTTGASLAYRLRVNITGSTKTGSTGNVNIVVNGSNVATIPVAEIGVGTVVKRDLTINVLASDYTINIADTFGDMTFSSATVELHTIEY